jgi:hypothetical protein
MIKAVKKEVHKYMCVTDRFGCRLEAGRAVFP